MDKYVQLVLVCPALQHPVLHRHQCIKLLNRICKIRLLKYICTIHLTRALCDDLPRQLRSCKPQRRCGMHRVHNPGLHGQPWKGKMPGKCYCKCYGCQGFFSVWLQKRWMASPPDSDSVSDWQWVFLISFVEFRNTHCSVRGVVWTDFLVCRLVTGKMLQHAAGCSKWPPKHHQTNWAVENNMPFVN